MTAYRNFVNDFPARCLELLDLMERQARLKQLDVTFALMVAAAGFVMPFERLNPKKPHPTGDSRKYADAAGLLAKLLEEKFLGSELGKGSSSWTDGRLDSIAGDPDCWEKLTNARKTTHNKTVGGIVRIVRNALAHGNIFTAGDPIGKIVLVCANSDDEKNIKDFSFISVCPEDFIIFLRGWLDFLKSADIPTDVVEQALANAA